MYYAAYDKVNETFLRTCFNTTNVELLTQRLKELNINTYDIEIVSNDKKFSSYTDFYLTY